MAIDIVIRRAETDDAFDIKRIQIEGWFDSNMSPATGVDEEFLRIKRGMTLPPAENLIDEVTSRIKNKETNNYLVAEVGSKVVGWIAGLFQIENSESGFGIYADRSYRDKGVGTALVKKLLDTNKNRKIAIEVNESNDGAKKFYKKFGFKITENKKHFFYDIKDVYLPVVVMRNY